MKRTLSALAGTVLLAAGPTACGGGPAKHAAPAASVLADRTLTGLGNASSVHFAGTVTGANAKGAIAFDITVVRGKGCEGSVTLVKQAGPVRFLTIGTKQWYEAGRAFWLSQGAGAPVAGRLAGTWQAAPAGSDMLAHATGLCGIEAAIRKGMGGSVRDVTRGLGGSLVDRKHGVTLDVTAGGAPRLLRLVTTPVPGSPGSSAFTFDRYGAAVTLTPPAAAK